MLKKNLRSPIKRAQQLPITNDDLNLSAKGINDGLLRVGSEYSSSYIAILGRIRRSIVIK